MTTTHQVPENHPLHKLEDERLFNAVFGHLRKEMQDNVREMLEASRAKYRAGSGHQAIFVGVHSEPDGLVFLFRDGDPI